ncbi:hypothetical protein RF11_09463 [Thelohanellus kitauei]|uniref:Uncharacterized protein n=1 Tax=Thelohanellus kitauei TaxID=669202 RepID=A0A0C2IUS0_THEKT|nr:hypothetical protein RF11_09463 [Thelohanellus kitauei]
MFQTHTRIVRAESRQTNRGSSSRISQINQELYLNFDFIHPKLYQDEIVCNIIKLSATIFHSVVTKDIDKPDKKIQELVEFINFYETDPTLVCYTEVNKYTKFNFQSWKQIIFLVYQEKIQMISDVRKNPKTIWFYQIQNTENIEFKQLKCIRIIYCTRQLVVRGNTDEETHWLFQQIYTNYVAWKASFERFKSRMGQFGTLHVKRI